MKPMEIFRRICNTHIIYKIRNSLQLTTLNRSQNFAGKERRHEKVNCSKARVLPAGM